MFGWSGVAEGDGPAAAAGLTSALALGQAPRDAVAAASAGRKPPAARVRLRSRPARGGLRGLDARAVAAIDGGPPRRDSSAGGGTPTAPAPCAHPASARRRCSRPRRRGPFPWAPGTLLSVRGAGPCRPGPAPPEGSDGSRRLAWVCHGAGEGARRRGRGRGSNPAAVGVLQRRPGQRAGRNPNALATAGMQGSMADYSGLCAGCARRAPVQLGGARGPAAGVAACGGSDQKL
jgi:hypothetical protein